MWSMILLSRNILSVPGATKELNCKLTMRSHWVSEWFNSPFCCHGREHTELGGELASISVAARLLCAPLLMAWVWVQKLSCSVAPRACNHVWYRSTLIAYFCGSLCIWLVASHEQNRLQLVRKGQREEGVCHSSAYPLCWGRKICGDGERKATAFNF